MEDSRFENTATKGQAAGSGRDTPRRRRLCLGVARPMPLGPVRPRADGRRGFEAFESQQARSQQMDEEATPPPGPWAGASKSVFSSRGGFLKDDAVLVLDGHVLHAVVDGFVGPAIMLSLDDDRAKLTYFRA